MLLESQRRTAHVTMGVIAVLAAVSVAAVMTLGTRGSWSFVLSFRGTRLMAILTVAYAHRSVDHACVHARCGGHLIHRCTADVPSGSRGHAPNIHLLVLVGIVLGMLFRSLSGFLQGFINPDDFVVF